MELKRLLGSSVQQGARLSWVAPTLLSIAIVEATRFTGFALPVPFLTIIVCVGLAGSQGGKRSGLIAGIAAGAFLVMSYFKSFGPPTLTGGALQVALGSLLFVGVGFRLGRLRDQLDTSIRSLTKKEKLLQLALMKETAEKDIQVAKVAEGEARLETAIRIAGIGHFEFDRTTNTCNFCSERYAANFGLTPNEFVLKTAQFNPYTYHVHVDDRHVVKNAIARLNDFGTQVFEYRALHPVRGIRYIYEIVEPVFNRAGNVTASIGTSIDITELREAEARLRQSQRVEAIGTLTGGVAHDFNNLLAVILGNLELSLETSQDDDKRELIENAIEATMRGASLTKNLLSFARRAHLEPTHINLNQIIRNTMTWGARVLPETVIIENSLAAELWDVELDSTSMENALINLLLNARDAMPEGGKVTIKTANLQIYDKYNSDRDEDIGPGSYVVLGISDTGHGIPADKFEKIFEPFYTEKPVGEGSGMGLSMVQGFIKQSGGAIRVYSEVGVGTTFKLYFKSAEQVADKPTRHVRKRLHSPKNCAKILVAEDEIEVMNILKSILENAGHSVTTANSGDEALEVFKSECGFDLLLTDVIMPGTLLGPNLAKEIRLINPNIPCIFLSGYASETAAQGNRLKPSEISLMKPVSRMDLLSAISKALEPKDEVVTKYFADMVLNDSDQVI